MQISTLCIGLLLALPVLAQDLLFHYERALESAPKFRSSQATRDAVQERRAQALAGFFPTIGATAARNRHDEEVITDSTVTSRPTGEARYSSSEYRLNLSQPIYNAAVAAGWRIADADLQRADAEYAASRQALMLEVAQAYFDVLLSQETLSLVRAEKETLSRQLESAEVRLKAGAGSITDVHDTQARFQTVLAQEIEAENDLDDKREALREHSGETPDSLANLHKDMPVITPEPPDMQRWTETAINQNLSLQAAKAAEESARQTISQHRAGHYPTLNLIGNHTRTDADGSIPGPGVRSDETVLGLQLNVPLFQGGLVNARVNEASHRYEAAKQDTEARKRAVERGARAAYQGVTGARAKIEALQHTITATSASVTAKREGYRAGVYTTVDVLDATRDLYRAQRDYAEARHRYVLSLLQLKLAAGTLSDSDIQAINRWLLP